MKPDTRRLMEQIDLCYALLRDGVDPALLEGREVVLLQSLNEVTQCSASPS